MAESTEKLRELWKKYECNEDAMVVIPFGPDRIRVAPETVAAWEALAAVLLHHRYEIRTTDTDSYNCRNIKGTEDKSLHAFGIALDINWTTNPFIDHPGSRKVRFSSESTQAERAEDVRLGNADTDFTETIISSVMAIKTKDREVVFEWGGHWKTVKDSMHFEIDLGPEALAKDIDTDTVIGWEAFLVSSRRTAEVHAAAMARTTSLPDLPPLPDLPGLPGLPPLQPLPPLPPLPSRSALPPLQPLAAVAASVDHFMVNARDGLSLRAGPDTTFAVHKTLAFGTVVAVIARAGVWAQVDLQGDGAADGFVHFSFLKLAGAAGTAAGAGDAARPSAATGADVLDLVTAARVKSIFPAATSLTNISNNLPFVLSGLRGRGLVDKPMALMALGTIRAETESFRPISEGVSRFNTASTPFDLYDAGTAIGRRLGNTQSGDGPMFKGRGYVQLTGRDNYTRIGGQIDQPLAAQSELANDPTIAGVILAQFLKNKENAIRAALAADDLKEARRLVNGGSHGLDRFTDTYRRGENVLPG